MGNVIPLITKRKKTIIILLVLATGFFLARKYIFGGDKELEQTQIKRGDVVEELILSGEVRADNHAKLAFPTSGKIAWINVNEGDSVTKGQALAKLDTTNLNADLKIAQSNYRAEEATVAKVHDDVKDHDDDETYTQRDTRTTAEVDHDNAWDALLKAEENLRNATLYAPFAGLVTNVTNPFSQVNVLATQTQIEIIDFSTIYFSVSADQSEVTSLYEGQEVTVIFDSFLDQEIQGQINYISYTPTSGEIGTIYQVKVALPQDQIDAEKIRVGMTGDAKIITDQKSGVLYVPPKYVNRKNGDKYLLVGSPQNTVIIQTGIEAEEATEVIGDNIKEGDIVYD